jgi:hypothetical protein
MNRVSSNRFANGVEGTAAVPTKSGWWNGAGWTRWKNITTVLCAVVTMRNLRLLSKDASENETVLLSLMPPTLEHPQRRLWVVVPGHGNADRLRSLNLTLSSLRDSADEQKIAFDCFVYVWNQPLVPNTTLSRRVQCGIVDAPHEASASLRHSGRYYEYYYY